MAVPAIMAGLKAAAPRALRAAGLGAAKVGAIPPWMARMNTPTKVAAGALTALPFAVGGKELIGDPIAQGVEDAFSTGSLENEIELGFAQMEADRFRAKREQRLMQLRAMNEAELAAKMPRLYQQLLAGRRLPRGGVVFGGRQPGRSVVDELTMAMARGEFPNTGEG